MELCSYTNKMLTEEDDDSPEKCRERRRRRIERRRLALATISPSSSSSSSSSSSTRRENSNNNNNSNNVSVSEMENPTVTSAVVNLNLTNVVDVVPVVGTMSVAGRQREMEDAVSVRMNLCQPEINGRRPIHFVGVFDGHGGPHVAGLCRERLHQLLIEELMRVANNTPTSASGGDSSSSGAQQEPPLQEGFEEEQWQKMLKNCFQKMDEVAGDTCACGVMGYICDCRPDQVLMSGSTAVVAILTPQHIIVANCGDSRAVLCRGGRAIPLSVDHKPDREDERARIEAVGGRVVVVDGARVEGILAMSRAIGDKYLKPSVTAEPEISFTKRDSEDECLILASDGLWDVMTSDTACEVASACLREEPATIAGNLNACSRIEDEGAGALFPSRSASAAALLTRLALGRRSADNISVIVVDLKRSETGA